jgi:hypothetical protein
MSMRWARGAIAAAVAGVSMAVAGCGGGDGLPREGISGKVTLDGKEIDGGNIQFLPTDPSGAGTGGGAVITGGQYRIDRDQGLVPGQYRVMIFAPDLPPGAASGAIPGEDSDKLAKERVPARYNSNSELKADVTKGGENTFDFDLKSS